MIEIVIRKAEKKDLPAIQKLLSTYFLDIEGLKPEDFVMAENEGKVVGCAALIRNRSGEKTVMELHSIAVHPNLRGKGIGTRLMEYLINTVDFPQAPGDPAHELYVRTTAPSFFEKLGFIKMEDAEKLLLWEDCRNCEHFGKCAQHSMKYFRVS
ncbi:Amino-acid acetyltransferase [Methanosarcina siciliae C2J]|uniref:Amino-acid acetyltransferase n=3 Tax=Methanosarcina siciliae TaxID=38027 RepID=A0A0E3PBW9_9EURY|nr:GNAT family N-acetyltransferase [Methanosarcina siciliae]AKB26917.1 Amino-acid acetyltransferase [Methanosarcina siciliae T4/M]AKB30884.1 Amino-acid acetyltransferase [Methanosarcina siciliae HI350]AKB34815.1 Amino-acid acetyltransferase [Methanosarcina siciliae C2J]